MDNNLKKKGMAQHRRYPLRRGKAGLREPLSRAYPIPKGDTPYVQAKRFEYIDKDLLQAERCYRLAIEQGERPESAVKDLAGVLVQQGKMCEARELLQTHQHLFSSDLSKYQNLLTNISKQTSVACRYLRLSGLAPESSAESIRALFSNPNRIHDIEIDKVEGVAVLKIMSHSAARKTIESFKARGVYELEELPSKEEDEQPLFRFLLFPTDPDSRCFTVPVDSPTEAGDADSTEGLSAVECIGEELYASIFGTGA